MANIKLPYFGNLDNGSLEEYYDAGIDFNGKEIQIDLNFEHHTIDIKRLEIVKHFIENLRIHDLNNKRYLQNDFDDKDADNVRFYVEKLLEETGTDELAELIGRGTKTIDQPRLLLKKLQLVRVGLYPDSETSFAVFDYTIGKELTDYLVVINTDENGNLDNISIEN